MFRTIAGTVEAPPKSARQHVLKQLRILPRTNQFARGDIADLQNYKRQRQKHTSFWVLLAPGFWRLRLDTGRS